MQTKLCLLLFLPLVFSNAETIDLVAKKAKHEVVETTNLGGIKIQKIKKRTCALQTCGEINDECGWCALSAYDASQGFGLKYEKEEETFDRPCADQHPGAGRFVKICERTRATVTVFEDCPGQYTFFKEDCPKPKGLEPLNPKTIPGTAERAPLVLPSIDALG